MTEKLGIAGIVRFDARHINDAELPDYFGAADLVAQPYTKVYESGVTLMAMTLGRPVLVSDLEPLTEVVGNGARGIVFKSRDPDDLMHKLNGAIDGKINLKMIAQRGNDFARSERSWSNNATALQSILQRELRHN